MPAGRDSLSRTLLVQRLIREGYSRKDIAKITGLSIGVIKDYASGKPYRDYKNYDRDAKHQEYAKARPGAVAYGNPPSTMKSKARKFVRGLLEDQIDF